MTPHGAISAPPDESVERFLKAAFAPGVYVYPTNALHEEYLDFCRRNAFETVPRERWRTHVEAAVETVEFGTVVSSAHYIRGVVRRNVFGNARLALNTRS